jgi:hypothetical protein
MSMKMLTYKSQRTNSLLYIKKMSICKTMFSRENTEFNRYKFMNFQLNKLYLIGSEAYRLILILEN